MTEEEARELKNALAELQRAFQELRAAYSELQEVSKEKDQRIEELERQLLKERLRNLELEKRQAKDSHNSSKPPSSDGFKHTSKVRPKSQKKSGGQPGHSGHALVQVAKPDQVIMHQPTHCRTCQEPLPASGGEVKERRQVHDWPVLRLEVSEHQVIEHCCPHCGERSRGVFPRGVAAAVQYGPRVQSLAVYLSQYQLLPLERIREVFVDLGLGSVSEGSVVNWVQEAAERLKPTLSTLKALLLRSRLTHVDETGGRIGGVLHWFHVMGTRWLTLYQWHRKRGREAMDAHGLLPTYTGRLMHDRWKSYQEYRCAHSYCGAHLLRDCLAVAELEKQSWAQEMHEVLLQMNEALHQARAQGRPALAPSVRDALVAQYFEILQRGYQQWQQTHPPPPPSAPKKRGRPKQDPGKNLLDALLTEAEKVLAFVDDFTVPFTNNLAERDLRMLKVQQKISGTFRSDQGATAFCTIRSYLSTMRKQGRSMLEALVAAFEDSPFPVAWEPGS